MIDPSTEPPFNDRRQGEAEAGWSDRPGILASLWRYWLVVVAASLLGAVAGYALAQQLPTRYRAQATLILSDPGGPSVLGAGDALASGDRKVFLDKQAEIMTSSAVLDRALQLLGSSEPVSDVRADLHVEPTANLASVSIAATRADPADATALANAVGTAYQQITQERTATEANTAIASLEKLREQYQADLDAIPPSPNAALTTRQQQLASQIADIQQREQDITTQVGVFASGIEYFEQAEQPTSPSQPKPKLAAALGALVGLLGAGAWAWWKAGRDQRAEDRSQPGRILDAPLLGEVPRLPAPTAHDAVASARLDPEVEDAFHLIVASMEHELTGVGGKTVAVTSLGSDDGRTSTALQIATAATREHQRVLVIDADGRERRLSHYVGADGGASPRGRHDGPAARGEQAGARRYQGRLVTTASGAVLPIDAEPDEGAEVHRVVDVRDAVRSIGDAYDLVLVDAPALLASSNALDIAGQADGLVLLVPHRVPLRDLREARDRLAFVKTPLLGYVYVRPLGIRAHRRAGERKGER